MIAIKNNRRQAIVVMNFPYRKKLGLGIYNKHNNEIIKVATFNNDESAEVFMEYLARFVGTGMEVEDERSD